MVGGIGNAFGILGKTRVRRYVELTTDNRLDAGFFALEIKFGRSEHIAVVGHGNGRHIQLFCLVDQVVKADGTVQKRILSVEMEMDEGGRGVVFGITGCFHWVLPPDESMRKKLCLIPRCSVKERLGGQYFVCDGGRLEGWLTLDLHHAYE